MNRWHGLNTYVRVTSAILLLVGFITFFEQTLAVPASRVSGTNYTSPNYGYTVTWQLPWYVVDDEVDAAGFDLLRIADSRSEALFFGGQFGYSNSAVALQQFAQQMEVDADLANFRSVEDPQCSIGEAVANISSACYRADITHSDGSQGAIGVFVKAWALADGVTLLMRALTEEPILSGYIPHWNGFGVYDKGSEPQFLSSGCSAESHRGISFCFDPMLSERDRSDIVEGVLLGESTVATMLDDPAIGTVNVTGLNAITPSGSELIATTYGDAIAVYAGSTLWQNATPIERIATMVHEYFHIFQNSMTGSSSATVPYWFTEGSAESFGYTVASQIEVTNQEEFYWLAYYKLTQDPVTGSLRDVGMGGVMSANEYPLVYMAVQHLLVSQGKSIEALVEVYQELGNGLSFETAFASVFGTTLDEFYGSFWLWRFGMPSSYSLDDDFYPNTLDEDINRGSFSWTTFPQGVDHGKQLVFVAQTMPLVDCTLTLYFGGTAVDRATWSNGQGEIFWLVSLPDGAVAGRGFVSVNCGEIVKSSVIGLT